MASGRLLRQLIKSGAEGDADSFRLLSAEVIKEEREKQHHLLANDLEKILYGAPAIVPSPTRSFAAVPADKDRGTELLTIKQSARSLSDVVLSSEHRTDIEEILLEHRKAEALRAHGLRPTDRVLFIGPPGCGKSLTAEIIAAELDRRLAVIRLDSVVSSYLGETAANLRKIFEYISREPLVVLFDEFDTISKERSSEDEHGELKRVVNAALQMFDDYRGRSLLIAATNHEGMLDSAVCRRFDQVLRFQMPTLPQVRETLRMKLRGVRREFDLEENQVAQLFKAYSFAGIERIARQAIKAMVLDGREFLRLDDLKRARERDKHRLNK